MLRYATRAGTGRPRRGAWFVHGVTALMCLTLTACGDDSAGSGVTGSSNMIDDGQTSISTQGERPVAVAGPDVTAEVGQRLSFDGSMSSDADGEVVTWNWDLGDGRQTTGAMIEHTYGQAGVYTVTLTVIDDDGLQDDDVLIVRVEPPATPNEAPVAALVAEQTAIEGEEFVVSAEGSADDEGIVSYAWRFGDEASDGEVTWGDAEDDGRATHVYGMWGEHTLQVEVADAQGLTGTAEQQVLVLAPPRAVMEGPQTTTVDTVISLTAVNSYDPDGTIVDYQWTLQTENSTTTLGTEEVLMYSSPVGGSYNIFVTVTDNSGLQDTAGFKVTVELPENEPPEANCGESPVEVVVNTELALDGRGSMDPDGVIERWTWDPGDGSEVLDGEVTAHRYTEVGEYALTLTVTDDRGGVDTAECAVNVVLPENVPPVANCGPAARSGQINDTLTFDGSQSADPDGALVSYRWDFGDGSDAGDGQVVTHAFGAAGGYAVTLTVTDDRGATDTATCQVNIANAPPRADCGAMTRQTRTDMALAFDGTGSTDPDGEVVAWSWDFGDGSDEVDGAEVSHTFGSPGEYTVTLTVTDDRGDSDSAECTVTAVLPPNAAPIANCTPDEAEVVIGSAVDLSGAASVDVDGEITLYVWDFDDGAPLGSGAEVSHTYMAVGEYEVELAVTDNRGDVGRDTCVVTVVEPPNTPPVADCGVLPSEIPVGEPLTLDGSSSSDADGEVVQWAWDPGDNSGIRLGEVVTHTYAAIGEYIITLTVTDDRGGEGATTCNMKVIAENIPPDADCGELLQYPVAGTPYTLDGSASMDPDGEIVEWFWDYGDGTNGFGERPEHTYAEAGTLEIELRVTDNRGDTDTANCIVAVAPSDNQDPIADVQAPITGIAGQAIIFNGRDSYDPDALDPMNPPVNGIFDYAWDFDDGRVVSDVSLRQISHTFDAPGTYVVTLTVTDQFGAEGQTIHTIQIEEGASFDLEGTYDITPDLSYTCSSFLGPATGYTADDFTFGVTGDTLQITGLRVTSNLVIDLVMTGDATTGEPYSAVGVVDGGAGSCVETYSLTNITFSDDDTWTGTFTRTFTGAVCGFTDCTNGSTSLEGARQ